MPDPLIASAFVKIKPEPKSVTAFGKDVRTAIEKSFTRPVRIKVEPTLLPFKKKIQTELSSAVFTIKVTPVLAPGFKSQLSKLAKEAAAGIAIPVTPVGKAGRAAATASKPATTVARGPAASTAAGREAAFQKRLNDLAISRTIAASKLTDALQVQGRAETRLSAVQSAESKASAALEKHKEALIKLESSLTQKQVGRLNTAVKAAANDLQAAAAARAVIEAEIAKAAALDKADAAKFRSSQIDIDRIRIEGELAAVQNAGALTTSKLAAARARLSASSAALTAASNLNKAAMETEDLALQRLTKDLVAKAAADKVARTEAVKSAIANEEAAAASAARAKAEAQLSKGLLATALAAAGARGATLAASFEFLAGAAIATALFKSVQLAAKLEEELNVFRVTAGATADEMERVSAAATRLGADITLPSVSANEAADAMTELAKAGLSVEDSIAAARGTLQLGTAAQLDNATAVNITASALNAFGLAGTEAVHVADLLAGAANAAQGGIGDMGQSLSSVASVARQAGVSVEDTVALLTLLAKNGIQGAEAGTALRVAIIRLIAPTDKARKIFEQFGIQVLDAQGNLRPEVFADIGRALDGVSASQRNAALQTIFGTRAIRAQAVIGREGAEGLNAMRDATNQAGAAARLAAARTEGFGGKVEALKNSAATLGLVIGESLIPTLGTVIESLATVTSGATDAAGALKDLKGSIPGLGGGILPDLTPGFDATLVNPDLKGTAARIKEIRASIDLVRQGNLGKAITDGLKGSFDLPSEQLDKFEQQIIDTTKSAQEMAEKLREARLESQKILQGPARGGRTRGLGAAAQALLPSGPVGAQIKLLQEFRKQIVGTSDDAQEARDRLDAMIRLTTALGRTPTQVELEVLFTKGGVDKATTDLQQRLLFEKFNVPVTPSIVIPGSLDREMREKGEQSFNQFKAFFGDTDLAKTLGIDWAFGFGQGATDEMDDQGKKVAAAFTSSFDTQIAVLEATGASDSAILAKLRQQLARRQNLLARAQAKFNANPTKKNDAFVGRAAGLVSDTQASIDSITGEQEAAAKKAADDIVDARNKADQAFLNRLSLGRGSRENAILRAEGTVAIEDDIKTHTVLRNFFRKKIEEASKTIKDAQTKAETIQSLTADLIQENQKLKELNQTLIDSLSTKFEARLDIAEITGSVSQIRKIYAEWINALQKALADATKGSKLAQELKLAILETQRAAFSAINEGFELDIQIAEAQERPAAEIKARERFIAQLRREQEQFRKGSLEWKRLQLEIINQQKAIDEAKKSNDDLNKSFQQLAFSFLTTQQGFGATLLSNLLPSGAFGHSVADKLAGKTSTSGSAAGNFGQPGGPQPGGGVIPGMPTVPGRGRTPGSAAAATAAAAEAGTAAGPTRGQQTVELDLLRQILRAINHLAAQTKHPENKAARAKSNAALDTHH